VRHLVNSSLPLVYMLWALVKVNRWDYLQEGGAPAPLVALHPEKKLFWLECVGSHCTIGSWGWTTSMLH